MASGNAVVARILSQYSDKGTKAAKKDIQQLGNDFTAFGKKVEAAFAVAIVASAAFAIKIGVDSVKAAIADQKSQALLNNTLKNTVGANEAVMKSVDAYIKKTELQLGITNEELRPSLQSLVTATHDVAKAQNLQSLAMDIAANRHKDLGTVSLALSKAYVGNYKALKLLGIPISEVLIKSHDFVGIVKELHAATMGAATVAANTLAVRMERMRLGFEEAKKSLGYALMPALEKFVGYLSSDVLPKLQAWIDANKEQLAAALEKGAKALEGLLQKAIKFGEWITTHTGEIKTFAEVLAVMWATAKVAEFVLAVQKVVAAFAVLRAAAATTAIFTALATGGASLAAGVAALAVLGIGAAWIIAANQANDASKVFHTVSAQANPPRFIGRFGVVYPHDAPNVTSGPVQGPTALSTSALAAIRKISDAKSAAALKELAAMKRIADANAAAAREKLKSDKYQAAVAAYHARQQAQSIADGMRAEAAKNRLKAMGINVMEPGALAAIEYEAARLNLVKQGNIAASEKFKKMQDNLELQMKTNEAAQRYADILAVLKDGTISTQEIAALSAKWGITSAAVEQYIAQIFAANATPADNSALVALYTSWGMTKEAATKYVDFLQANKDGKISDAEITNLADKWGMTKAETTKYVDYLQANKDGKISDAEIKNLADKWGVSTKSVTDYIATISTHASFSNTFANPGISAQSAWVAALNALNAYNAAVGKGATGSTGSTGGTGSKQALDDLLWSLSNKRSASVLSYGSRDNSSATSGAGSNSNSTSGTSGTPIILKLDSNVIATAIIPQLQNSSASGINSSWSRNNGTFS
jgi:hypothetical protein